jgi:hypothetical protein
MITLSRFTVRPLATLSLALLVGLVGCGKKGSDGDGKKDESSAEAKDTGPCSAASGPLAGIAILEVKEVPDGPEAGARFVRQLESEISAVCTDKGMEKSAGDALGCYAKNKGKRGYFVWKGCDEAPGKELVAAVVEKHGGKKAQ